MAGAVLEHATALLLVCNQRRNGSLDWSTPGGVIDADDDVRARRARRARSRRRPASSSREWEGPLYEVTAVALDLGWVMRCEVHRAVAFEGELRVDDPDGIVVDAAFVPPAECIERPARGVLPLGARAAGEWLAERWGPDGAPRVPLRRARHVAATRSRCVARARDAGVGRTPTSPSILHVDLDAFYASVEQLADPSLRGQAGRRRRARPPRRRRGRELRGAAVRHPLGDADGARPAGVSRRRVPRAPLRRVRARRAGEVMAILRDVTPLVEPISLDEAFLDVARRAPAARRRARDRGSDSAARIRDETGLTASVGVATTKLLAKLASDLAKPDGLLVVEPGHRARVPAPAAGHAGSGASAPRPERGSTRSASTRSATSPTLPEDDARARARPARAARTSTRSRGTATTAAGRARPGRRSRSGTRRRSPTDVTDRDGLERERRPAGRRGGGAPARAPARRAHGAAEAALRRLPHDHPVAHAAEPTDLAARDRRHRAHAPRRGRPRRGHPAARRLGAAARGRRRGAGSAPGRSTSRPRGTRTTHERRAGTARRESVDARCVGRFGDDAGRAGRAPRCDPAPPTSRRRPDRDDAGGSGSSGAGTSARSTRSRCASSPTPASSTRDITATYDVDPERAAQLAEPPRRARSHADLDAAARRGRRRVDLHLDRRPPARSSRPRSTAASPVFCEKPLAPTLADCLEIAALLEQVPHQVGLVLRHAPVFRPWPRPSRRAGYGRPMALVLRDDQYFPIQGMYGSTWRSDVDKAGGGTLIEHSIHDLDVLDWILGDPATVARATPSAVRLPGHRRRRPRVTLSSRTARPRP